MPSLPTTSSVFGRFSAKKATATATEPAAPVEARNRRLSIGGPVEAPTQTQGVPGHRRESSALSLSSVTELGQTVKRSVSLRSLRSHRSQPSNTSNTLGHKTRASSGGIAFNPTLTTSPAEDEDEPQSLPPSNRTTPPSLPRSRGNLSLSSRSLSSKLSSQSLSSAGHLDSLDGAIRRPTTAVEVRKVPSATMIGAPFMQARLHSRHIPPPPPVPMVPENGLQNGLYLQSTATPVPHNASSHDPKAVYKQIHDVSAKRIATIEYLRRVHEGNIFYFSTMHYSPTSLQSIPSMHPLKLGRRATNYFVLGYSLPALLDLNAGTALEYLRALTALLQEFETYQTLMGVDSSGNSLSRGRVGNMFKIGNRAKQGRRTSTANDSIFLPPSDHLSLDTPSPLETSPSPSSPGGHDFQHLVTPHLPFDPDFTTVYATLCDTVADTYAKLVDLVHSPEVCTPAVSDAFAKVDKTIRKILVSNVMREFEEATRANVKSEVAGLGKLVLGGLM